MDDFKQLITKLKQEYGHLIEIVSDTEVNMHEESYDSAMLRDYIGKIEVLLINDEWRFDNLCAAEDLTEYDIHLVDFKFSNSTSIDVIYQNNILWANCDGYSKMILHYYTPIKIRIKELEGEDGLTMMEFYGFDVGEIE